MADDVIGPVRWAGVNLETWLIRYDKHGKCESPQTRELLLDRLASQQNAPVILFSHGWNNEYEDASTRYANLLKHLQQHFNDHGKPAHLPIFVGILWPSTWFSTDMGPAMAGDTQPEVVSADFKLFQQELAERLSVDLRARFNTLSNMSGVTSAEAKELAALTAQVLKGGTPSAPEGAEAATVDEGAVFAAMVALPSRSASQPGSDAGADVLPEGGTVGGGAATQAQAAGLFSFLDPRNALRVASVYTMKDRAGTVGFQGVSQLISAILQRTQASLHLVGHSYGTKVVLSATAAATLPEGRKVETMLLLQPAISYQSFAEQVQGRNGKGGYVAVPQRVNRHIATTFSRWDNPLHNLFHLALRRSKDLADAQIAAGNDGEAGEPPSKYAALGGYGPRRSGELLVKELPLPGTPIPELEANRLVSFDGTKEKRISSHGDVSTKFTAWLLYKQLIV